MKLVKESRLHETFNFAVDRDRRRRAGEVFADDPRATDAQIYETMAASLGIDLSDALMTRLALLVIRLATPPREREWVVGDTVEELARIRDGSGERAARRWLQREMGRVLVHAPRHRLAVSYGSAVAAPPARYQ
jgi:hypothetical protein